MELFRTKRAIIRPFKISDLNDLIEMMADASVMKFTGFKKPQDAKRVEDQLEKWINEGKSSLGVWASESIEDKHFIGWVMLKRTICEDPELGFMLPRSKWGNGYATEIAKGILDYGLNSLGCNRIIASTVSDNSSSINVLKKIGMIESKSFSINDNVIYFEKSK